MPSIADRLAATNNRPAGFDYMRLALASSIIAYHTVATSYGEAAQTVLDESPLGPIVTQLVPMFFCLSGFLVAGSLDRSRTLISFLGLRVFRIIPALCAETLLSAFILGAIFTTLPPSRYFSDPHLWAYLHNIYGDVHLYLPGVFTSNPCDKVNGQLWTIPAEIRCYEWIAFFFALTLARRKWTLLIVCATWMSVRGLRDIFAHHVQPVGFMMPTELLIFCFFGGVLLYLFRPKVPWDWKWGVASCSAALFLPLTTYGIWLLPIPAAYATVWIGLANPRKFWPLETGDYSYGLYLYGYPIQQAIVTFAPLRHWWLNFLIAYTLAFGFAALSWHILEKRVLLARPWLFRSEAWAAPIIDRQWPVVAYRGLISWVDLQIIPRAYIVFDHLIKRFIAPVRIGVREITAVENCPFEDHHFRNGEAGERVVPVVAADGQSVVGD